MPTYTGGKEKDGRRVPPGDSRVVTLVQMLCGPVKISLVRTSCSGCTQLGTNMMQFMGPWPIMVQGSSNICCFHTLHSLVPLRTKASSAGWVLFSLHSFPPTQPPSQPSHKYSSSPNFSESMSWEVPSAQMPQTFWYKLMQRLYN